MGKNRKWAKKMKKKWKGNFYNKIYLKFKTWLQMKTTDKTNKNRKNNAKETKESSNKKKSKKMREKIKTMKINR